MTEAVVEGLSISVNAGSADVTLPAAEFSGSASVNAGSLTMCVPEGSALRVTSSAALGSVEFGPGFSQPGRRLGDARLGEQRPGLRDEPEREPRIG